MASSKFQGILNSFTGGNMPNGIGNEYQERKSKSPNKERRFDRYAGKSKDQIMAEMQARYDKRNAESDAAQKEHQKRYDSDPAYRAEIDKKREEIGDIRMEKFQQSNTGGQRFATPRMEQQGPNAGVAGSAMREFQQGNTMGQPQFQGNLYSGPGPLRGSSNSMNTAGSTNSQTGNTGQIQGGDAPINFPGMFNLQGIMDGFYGYKPKEDDELGNAMKMSFASNMIQSGFDAMLAQQMAQYQAGLGQQNMKVAADLEYRNNSEMMGKEFEYGMASMGAQFDYQNQFANAQYDRDIGMLGAQGVDKRKTDSNLANEQRLNTIVAGEQQRMNTELQGGFDVDRAEIAADANKYGAQQAADATKFGAKASAEASKDVAITQAGASMYGSKEAADANRFTASAQERASKYASDAEKYGADAQERASKYGADMTNDASRYGSEQARAGAENVAETQAGAQVESARLSKEASTYQTDASVKNTDRSSRASENVADRQARATEYGADASERASKYGADQTRIASMYGADKNLEGVKDTNLTSTRNIRATGDEQRRSAAQADKFSIAKENRAAARSRAGARRY